MAPKCFGALLVYAVEAEEKAEFRRPQVGPGAVDDELSPSSVDLDHLVEYLDLEMRLTGSSTLARYRPLIALEFEGCALQASLGRAGRYLEGVRVPPFRHSSGNRTARDLEVRGGPTNRRGRSVALRKDHSGHEAGRLPLEGGCFPP
jgi:hypothetical protein